MWKKEEGATPQPTSSTPTRPSDAAPAASRTGHATIGKSIVIRGEVSGDEDLLIQGQVDGSVRLGMHAVVIGDGGRVKADVTGRVITVEGEVEGDLLAQEQIVLRGSARVQGDLKAPRVVLEDGASFRGLVDMGTPKEAAKPATAQRPPEKPGPAEQPRPQPGREAAHPAGRAPEGAGAGAGGGTKGKGAPGNP